MNFFRWLTRMGLLYLPLIMKMVGMYGASVK
jgi:hypothetical protein